MTDMMTDEQRRQTHDELCRAVSAWLNMGLDDLRAGGHAATVEECTTGVAEARGVFRLAIKMGVKPPVRIVLQYVQGDKAVNLVEHPVQSMH